MHLSLIPIWQQSIYNGLKEISDGIVLIHDGVRPFISSQLIKENIETARVNKIAITCVKAKETLVLSLIHIFYLTHAYW